MLRTIVAGTDGSDTATVAVEHAVDLADKLDAELVVVSAFPEPERDRRSPAAAGSGSPAAIARALLRDVEGRHGRGVALRTVAVPGSPAVALVRQAEQEGADLLVVGNRGLAQAQWLRPSVPGSVAHRAPISVLVVDTMGARVPGYERILVGAGGGATARAAVDVASWLAERLGAHLTAAVVGPAGEGAPHLRDASEGRPGTDIRALEGSPPEELCKLAESDGYDLLVVGNRGMTGTRRVLGSVPDRVSRRARTNVLIVHTVE